MSYRVECPDCDEDGYSHHDCGEDSCACLNPYPNVVCDKCGGKTYWLVEDTPEALAALDKSDLRFEWVPMKGTERG